MSIFLARGHKFKFRSSHFYKLITLLYHTFYHQLILSNPKPYINLIHSSCTTEDVYYKYTRNNDIVCMIIREHFQGVITQQSKNYIVIIYPQYRIVTVTAVL